MHLARCTPDHAHMCVCVCVCVCVCRAANRCRCLNGSPKTGPECTKQGAAMCSSCKGGFTINTGQTACSSTCHWLELQRIVLGRQAYIFFRVRHYVFVRHFLLFCLFLFLLYLALFLFLFLLLFCSCMFLLFCLSLYRFRIYGFLDVLTLTTCRPGSL